MTKRHRKALTGRRKTAAKKRTGAEDTEVEGVGVTLIVIYSMSFAGAVVINYYLWGWIAPKFGWLEIGFWWFVPITIVVIPLRLILNALLLFLFSRKG